MEKIHAVIKGVGGYVPDYILTNDELSRMVDTTDEWIMTRIGIKERRLLREEGKATSDLGVEAVKNLFAKTGTKPEEVDLLICATVTPDMRFPATSCIICDKMGIKNAFAFDLTSGCSGFVYALSTAARFVESGRYKKVVLVGAEVMSSIIDYTDRATCPIFGDGAGAVLLEPSTEAYGVLDEEMGTDGCGRVHLHMKAGGSLMPPTHETIDKRLHYVYQEGQPVFKWAVVKMADVAEAVMKRNHLDPNKTWLVPHQANLRIIDAVARRMELSSERVMINIQKYGNTTAATIPLLLWEWENKLKKGDDLVICAFGSGFSWGAIWLKWAY
ncbi:MAG: ketoacyl-ACP synthase III [Bacteroidales bacterium]|nr:ketoacyl-ACP synthase III [Bacteroidales bacterium]MDE6308127.1 ketoacyl-ACP synthase III [Bacteroidales bacterium]